MCIKKLSLAIAAIIALLANTVWANGPSQPNPYAGQQQRSIKALSSQEISDLEAGRGMGLSKVAELNHYPGPKHVLELAAPLQLTETQIRQMQQLQLAMTQDAQWVGKQILATESALEVLFTARQADEVQTGALIASIAQLQGELRLVHVNAHVATARLLSVEQIAAYDRLRGYADGAVATHPHHH